jgi:hypothetical protein
VCGEFIKESEFRMQRQGVKGREEETETKTSQACVTELANTKVLDFEGLCARKENLSMGNEGKKFRKREQNFGNYCLSLLPETYKMSQNCSPRRWKGLCLSVGSWITLIMGRSHFHRP